MSRNLKTQPPMPHRGFRLALKYFVWFVVRLLFRLEFQGLEHVPASGPVILVGNHTSMFDMLVIHTRIKPWICWVAKKELFSVPVLGGILRLLGCIPVDRDKTDLLAARAIFKSIRDRQIIGMYPQGTRVKPDRVPFVRPRTGAVHFAIKTGTPMMPVAVAGRFRLFGKVRIIFGPLIELGLDPHDHYSQSELNRLTIETMQRVYSLIGVDYQLAPGVMDGE